MAIVSTILIWLVTVVTLFVVIALMAYVLVKPRTQPLTGWRRDLTSPHFLTLVFAAALGLNLMLALRPYFGRQ